MDEMPQPPWLLPEEVLAKVESPAPEPPEPFREEEPREAVRDLRRTTRQDVAIAAALSLIAFLSVVSTYRGIGWSWDEAYYYAPAQMTAKWVAAFLQDPGHAASRAVVDWLWAGELDPHSRRPVGIIEMPSLVKWAMGLSWAALRGGGDEMRALRFPAALAFGLSVFLIYLLTLNSYRRRAAIIAAVAFMTMPRVFGHAHIAATETIFNAAVLLAIYCFFRGLNSPLWAILCGVAYGLALDTKINAVLLAPVLLIWGHAFYRRAYVNNFFAMVFLSPLVWVLLWPWLWHDTFARLMGYLGFFSQHQFTAVWYLGERFGFGQPNAPWHYPIVLTLVTVPVPILAVSICGVARTAAACRWEYRGILFTAYAVMVLLYASLPATPKYDGTRLFFSLFPMLAILAGGGADSLVRIFPFDRMLTRKIAMRHVVAGVFVAMIAGNGIWAIARIHPHELAYFNFLTGGLAGAQHRFEHTYWGEALNERVIAALNELPPGARVKPLAMHPLVLRHLQQWGRLRADLLFETEPPYDFWLLHFRKGFFAQQEPIPSPEWSLYGHVPMKEFSFRGAPFFALYSRKEAGALAQP